MRDMSPTDTAQYETECNAIKVIPYDMAKLSEDLTKQLNQMPEHKGKLFEVKDKKLARVITQDMITDDEACFYVNIDKGFKIDVYQKGVEKTDENGKTSTPIYMYPTCTITLSEEDLKEYSKEETTLKEFMGDRFIYNKRMVGNIDFMISKFR